MTALIHQHVYATVLDQRQNDNIARTQVTRLSLGGLRYNKKAPVLPEAFCSTLLNSTHSFFRPSGDIIPPEKINVIASCRVIAVSIHASVATIKKNP